MTEYQEFDMTADEMIDFIEKHKLIIYSPELSDKKGCWEIMLPSPDTMAYHEDLRTALNGAKSWLYKHYPPSQLQVGDTTFTGLEIIDERELDG